MISYPGQVRRRRTHLNDEKSMYSPIYWHPFLYELSMRMLYRSGYGERIKAVSVLIADHATVADVCAGDCSLYRYGLQHKDLVYTAYDINPMFVRWGVRRNIDIRKLDLRHDPMPRADYVVMMGSLYQFIPNERIIIDQMMNAAAKRVILVEPVRNLSQHVNPVLRKVARFFSSVDDQPCDRRLNETGLRQLLADKGFQTMYSIVHGRELLACCDIVPS